MPQREKIFTKAEELENKYDWIKAADVYEQALSVVGKEDFLRKGQIQEKIGFCFHVGAMQAENPEEFKERMQRAIRA